MLGDRSAAVTGQRWKPGLEVEGHAAVRDRSRQAAASSPPASAETTICARSRFGILSPSVGGLKGIAKELEASLAVVRKSLGRRRKVTGPSRLTSNKVSVQVLAGPTPVLIRPHLRPLATTLLGATAEVMRTQPRVGSSGTLTG